MQGHVTGPTPTSHPATLGTCCARLCPSPSPLGSLAGTGQADGWMAFCTEEAKAQRPGLHPRAQNLHPHPHGTANHVPKSPTQGLTPDPAGGSGQGARLRMP